MRSIVPDSSFPSRKSSRMETKNYFCILFLLFLWTFVAVDSEELVAVFAPRIAFKSHKYNVFIQAKNIEHETELAVQFRHFSRTYTLKDNNIYTVNYPTNSTGSVKKLNFTATLYREKVRGLDKVHQCSTQHLEIKVDKPIFYTFIQTDKPIYNPREDVQFRIIVVDKDLKPRVMNNIDIEIVDPLNRTIDKFTDLEGKNRGIYVEKFTISRNPLFGAWRIRVTVDKFKSLTTSKSFAVQKFELPLFGVHIETSEKDYLPESRIVIKFHAGYAFGGNLAGNAVLVIQNVADGVTYYTKEFKNVVTNQSIAVNIKKDFNTQIYNRVDLKATLMFTELESGLTYNKSTDFTVHADSTVKLTPVHPTKFTPGFPFDFKVFVQNWNNETYKSQDEVEMDYIFKLSNGTRQTVTFHPLLNNGTAEQYTMVPENAIEFAIQCRFLNSRVYRVNVGMAKPDHESKKLEINYYPKRPFLGSTLDVHVLSETLLDNIIVAIMTKYGNIDTRMIECKDKIVCSFQIGVVEEMIPKFTLEVYYVRHMDAVDYGTVEINTGNIGENYLKMNLSQVEVNSRKTVTMTFNTTEESKIFLLAVDKRVTFLGTTNDIKRDDIMHKVGHIDTRHAVLLDDMKSWTICTPEELLRIENGRQSIVPHSNGHGFFDEDDGEQDDFSEGDYDEESEDKSEEVNLDDVRENFPHTWLFETIDSNTAITERTYKVPDSMTSWHISAFSVHDQKGLAIMRPRDLRVKNEFFIKFNLPYSLRYKEILKIDVIVFNHNKNNKDVDVKVKMLNLQDNSIAQFEFVEYDNCAARFNKNRSMIQEAHIPKSQSKKVSFYIRSNPMDKDFTAEKYINIIVIAEASDKHGNTYKDAVRKRLRIENFGVKLVDIYSDGYVLSGNSSSDVLHTNSTDTYSHSYCIITGDYLSEKISIDSDFESHSNDLIEHRLAKLKWNINLHQYSKSMNKSRNDNYFKEEYQDILGMRGSEKNDNAGFISFYVDTLASAMNEKLIFEDPDVIEKELDILKGYQLETGEFTNFGSMPEYNKNSSDYNKTKIYFETAQVLIAFLKSDRIVEQKYTDVITKALDFLEDNSHAYSKDNEALSVAAYAFSLRIPTDNYEIKTKNIMDDIEKTLIDHGGKDMCVKLKSTDDDCDVRHTAYTAMTYINLNLTQKAVPLAYWLLKSYNFKDDYYNSAIISEPIAKLAQLLHAESTDITVTVHDEFNFKETLKLVDGNSTDFHVVNFPTHSKIFSSKVTGYGFVSITKVIERTLDFAIAIEPTFHIAVQIMNNQTITKFGEIVINVCAKYDKDSWDVIEIMNVIFEIQMPSGYIFDEIIDLDKQKKNIQIVKEGRKKSYVIVHFLSFLESQNYCINIRAVKMFDVINPQKSSVKVFSFAEKKNFGLEFYEAPNKDAC
ncbi:thioester-containing protein 1 allele R1-like [Chironomus tepperi]|uniref:thioester-containing protein 1 allele R1-like n=1 Tax=Chironomus tepperi TaxID=113505 RepID=UPI00391F1DED